MKNQIPPLVRKEFLIVVHLDKPHLGAEVLSYLYRPGVYIPIFSFAEVDVPADGNAEEPDIYAIQRRRAEEFDIFFHNGYVENGGFENILLIGITVEQISYLRLPRDVNVIEIDEQSDLDAYLGAFSLGKADKLECTPDEMPASLTKALNENKLLSVNGFSNNLDNYFSDNKKGIVLVETVNNSNLIVAINYACSIDAQVVFLPQLDESQELEVLDLLEKWSGSDADSLIHLKNIIADNLGNIDFNEFEFATFFTSGLPYSLVVSDIPISYVNIRYDPGFFIYNSFMHEKNKGCGSAVIFSPVFFKDEECKRLKSLLEFANFYTRTMIGETATQYNLKNTVELYPFDLLHICSHGGEVTGHRCIVQFQDINNDDHEIEFEHILNIALTPYKDLHSVESLYYFKKLDGLRWKSDELKAKKYPYELYASLQHVISKAFDSKTVIYTGLKGRVYNSNAIYCTDFNYMAIFSQMGVPELHPLIFNNSCSSWLTVSTSFLAGGARGYIGTVRDIANDIAVRYSEQFYDNVFKVPIIEALFIASKDLKQKGVDDPYIFWGLHFSTLENVHSVRLNRHHIIRLLNQNLLVWRRKFQKGQGAPKLVEGRINDTKWIITSVNAGSEVGHVPLISPKKSGNKENNQ